MWLDARHGPARHGPPPQVLSLRALVPARRAARRPPLPEHRSRERYQPHRCRAGRTAARHAPAGESASGHNWGSSSWYRCRRSRSSLPSRSASRFAARAARYIARAPAATPKPKPTSASQGAVSSFPSNQRPPNSPTSTLSANSSPSVAKPATPFQFCCTPDRPSPGHILARCVCGRGPARTQAARPRCPSVRGRRHPLETAVLPSGAGTRHRSYRGVWARATSGMASPRAHVDSSARGNRRDHLTAARLTRPALGGQGGLAPGASSLGRGDRRGLVPP